jgi:exodeoxyribonuclease-3
MSLDEGQLALIPGDDRPEHRPMPGLLRVMTWNVQHANPGRSMRQASWIADQDADVIVLTEVSATDGGHTLVQALRERGFAVCCPTGSDGYRTLVASRVGKQDNCLEVTARHLPHRCVAVRLHLDDGRVAGVVGLYVPSRGSRERRNVDKRAFQNAVIELLPGLAETLAVDGPIVIAGDLNVVEPGHRPHHTVFGAWEYDFYAAFANIGYPDAFRHLHPDEIDHSWYGRRSGAGYRFDHIFCSPIEAVTDCRYLHEPRLTGLSDHSAMTSTLTVTA